MLRNDRMRVRSVMLAEFQRGADEKRAFARVCLEFGPKAVTQNTLEKWFAKFRRGDTTLADRRKGRRLGGRQALSADRFAAVQRAFCGRMESSFVFEKFVFEGRFMVLPFQPSVRMVDLYHMKEVPLNFDLKPPARMTVNLEEFRLVDLRRAFCRLKYEGGGQQQRWAAWCSWDFEERQVAVDGPLVSLGTEEEYWKHVVNAGDDPSLLHYVVAQRVDGELRDFYQCIQLKGGRFEVKQRVALPEKLHEPFLFHNGHLFAFERCAERFGWPEFRKLLKIALATGHAVELPTFGWLEENEKRHTSQLWVGTTMIVRCEPEVNAEFVHRLWAFDLRSLQWRPLELDFEDELPFLYSDDENLLFVHGYKSGREKDSLYRFPINRPDRLSAIAWRSVRRRADFDPAFLPYALKQLPKNSPIRCPFPFANQ
ncbi:Histone-lysine N-methyltransferase SETMAR-like protein [Aphelenchoides fujianensis]|nr:Histone-lysine N-methyltransferase SETMAR-like protein [Aphelenchoides fujianensis]